MNKVKQMMRAGVSLPTAVKELLAPMTLAEFAERHGRSVTTMSNVINGNVKPNKQDVQALIAEFGGTEYEWRMLLWEHSKPTSVAV